MDSGFTPFSSSTGPRLPSTNDRINKSRPSRKFAVMLNKYSKNPSGGVSVTRRASDEAVTRPASEENAVYPINTGATSGSGSEKASPYDLSNTSRRIPLSTIPSPAPLSFASRNSSHGAKDAAPSRADAHPPLAPTNDENDNVIYAFKRAQRRNSPPVHTSPVSARVRRDSVVSVSPSPPPCIPTWRSSGDGLPSNTPSAPPGRAGAAASFSPPQPVVSGRAGAAASFSPPQPVVSGRAGAVYSASASVGYSPSLHAGGSPPSLCEPPSVGNLPPSPSKPEPANEIIRFTRRKPQPVPQQVPAPPPLPSHVAPAASSHQPNAENKGAAPPLSSEPPAPDEPVPCCPIHKRDLHHRIAQKGRNLNRRFWCCPVPLCNFFRWDNRYDDLDQPVDANPQAARIHGPIGSVNPWETRAVQGRSPPDAVAVDCRLASRGTLQQSDIAELVAVCDNVSDVVESLLSGLSFPLVINLTASKPHCLREIIGVLLALPPCCPDLSVGVHHIFPALLPDIPLPPRRGPVNMAASRILAMEVPCKDDPTKTSFAIPLSHLPSVWAALLKLQPASGTKHPPFPSWLPFNNIPGSDQPTSILSSFANCPANLSCPTPAVLAIMIRGVVSIILGQIYGILHPAQLEIVPNRCSTRDQVKASSHMNYAKRRSDILNESGSQVAKVVGLPQNSQVSSSSRESSVPPPPEPSRRQRLLDCFAEEDNHNAFIMEKLASQQSDHLADEFNEKPVVRKPQKTSSSSRIPSSRPARVSVSSSASSTSDSDASMDDAIAVPPQRKPPILQAVSSSESDSDSCGLLRLVSKSMSSRRTTSVRLTQSTPSIKRKRARKAPSTASSSSDEAFVSDGASSGQDSQTQSHSSQPQKRGWQHFVPARKEKKSKFHSYRDSSSSDESCLAPERTHGAIATRRGAPIVYPSTSVSYSDPFSPPRPSAQRNSLSGMSPADYWPDLLACPGCGGTCSRCAEILRRLPCRISQEMLPHQRVSVCTAVTRRGRVLFADDMGLGKTVQAIATATYYHNDWPLLIVCGSGLRDMWQTELSKWLPPRFTEYNGTSRIHNINTTEQAKQVLNIFDGERGSRPRDILIISYNIATTMAAQLSSIFVDAVVIFDEAHSLKDTNSNRVKSLGPLGRASKRLFLLTGTPALAKPFDLFELVRMLQPRVYTNRRDFAMRYSDSKKTRFGINNDGFSNLCELTAALDLSLMIRRTKADALNSLATKHREAIQIPTQGKGVDPTAFADFDEEFSSKKAANGMLEAYREAAGLKIPGVVAYLKSYLQPQGNSPPPQTIVFAHHVEMINAIEGAVQEVLQRHHATSSEPWGYIILDGKVPPKRRVKLLNDFRSNPCCIVAIVSITAAGQGLDFTPCSRAIFAELHWTPGILQQAEDRIHRITQKSPRVDYYYLLGSGTADDHLWPMIRRKLALVACTLGEAVLAASLNADSRDRLSSIVRPKKKTITGKPAPSRQQADPQDEDNDVSDPAPRRKAPRAQPSKADHGSHPPSRKKAAALEKDSRRKTRRLSTDARQSGSLLQFGFNKPGPK